MAVAALPVVFWLSVGNVQLAKLPEEGVPSAGVTSVGLFEKTLLPVPVKDAVPTPPFAIGKMPVTPPVREMFVQFDKLPEAGVPKIGVTSVGLFDKTTPPVPVEAVVDPVPPLATGRTPVTLPERETLVQFDKLPEAGVPSTGAVNVGVAIVGEMRCVFCWVKFVPSLHTVITLPAGIATPVPAAVVLPITLEL